MTDAIKIDIVSDVVCPWCVIGYKRLTKAIADIGIKHMVEVEWHPFQLNPGMGVEGEEVNAHMAQKYGMTMEDSRRTLAQMSSLGAEIDFTFDFFDGFKMVNTSDLHILLDFAKEAGKQTELKMRLFSTCFTEQKNVSDREVLAEELQKIGLDVNEGIARLDNQTIRNKVLAHEIHWKNLGVTGVPTMIFNNSNTYTGAQPISIYTQILSSCLQGDFVKQLDH